MARAHVLTADLRLVIENLWRQGATFEEIAVAVGTDFSTVWRELDRHNSHRHGVKNPLGSTRGGLYRWGYNAQWAQEKAQTARARPKPARLAQPGPLRDAVIAGLRDRHSPQQVAARLRRDFSDDEHMQISHETIYQAIYIQSRGNLRLLVDDGLRVKHRRRRSQSRAVTTARAAVRYKPWVTEEVHIRARPAEVTDRAVPGHWEGDLLIGSHGRSAIITLAERSTRFVLLGALPLNRSSPEVLTVIRDLFRRLPEHLTKTVTWDQGVEMAEHHHIQLATDCRVYICDPHSPWQRGTNENTNGLLRDYFPRGRFDFRTIDQAGLDVIADQLNRRPRQTLDWDTPTERLNQLLLAPTG